MKKLFLGISVALIVAVAVINLSVDYKNGKGSSLSTVKIFSLAKGEDGKDGKDDEKNQDGTLNCPNGSTISCVLCLKGTIDCSPTCDPNDCPK
jgi:hypothetical protein